MRCGSYCRHFFASGLQPFSVTRSFAIAGKAFCIAAGLAWLLQWHRSWFFPAAFGLAARAAAALLCPVGPWTTILLEFVPCCASSSWHGFLWKRLWSSSLDLVFSWNPAGARGIEGGGWNSPFALSRLKPHYIYDFAFSSVFAQGITLDENDGNGGTGTFARVPTRDASRQTWQG